MPQMPKMEAMSCPVVPAYDEGTLMVDVLAAAAVGTPVRAFMPLCQVSAVMVNLESVAGTSSVMMILSFVATRCSSTDCAVAVCGVTVSAVFAQNVSDGLS